MLRHGYPPCESRKNTVVNSWMINRAPPPYRDFSIRSSLLPMVSYRRVQSSVWPVNLSSRSEFILDTTH